LAMSASGVRSLSFWLSAGAVTAPAVLTLLATRTTATKNPRSARPTPTDLMARHLGTRNGRARRPGDCAVGICSVGLNGTDNTWQVLQSEESA
jgi:hypothetical protein